MSNTLLSSLIGIYFDDMVNIIKNLDDDLCPELEFKVNFKKNNYDKVKIVESLENILLLRNINYKESHTVDYFIDKERYTTNSEEINVTKTTKKRLLNIKTGEALSNIFDSTISLSSEEDFEMTGANVYKKETGLDNFHELHEEIKSKWNDKASDVVKNWNKDGNGFKRKKARKGFLFFPDVRIDITRVNTMSMSGKSFASNEIEVELLSDITKDSLDRFIETISFVSSSLETICLIRDFNMWTSYPEQKIENYKEFVVGNLSNPRNLKKKDYVWGGLIPYGPQDVLYSVTVKGDGLRKNLVIHHTGIWLVRPKRGLPIAEKITFDFYKKSMDLYKKSMDSHGKFLEPLTNYIGTVIDGELMSDGQYIPFDCLSINGNSKIQKLPHIPSTVEELSQCNNRVSMAKKVCDLVVKYYQIPIFYKKFFSLGKNWQKTISSLEKCEQYLSTFSFPTDGYIFTPINYDYNVKSKGKEDGLLMKPETCKIKPWDRLSIDFYFNSIDKIPMVYDGGKLVSFIGRGKVPFSAENFELPPVFDVTVEMEPLKNEESSNIVMIFRKIREDKGANKLKVALDVWQDINDPIFIDDLKGETFRFNRLFQNRIKTLLLDIIENGSYVLDIGSGNGGDLDKYKNKVSKLFAIDPNEDNMKEFTRRLASLKSKMVTQTLLAGGEESELIIESSARFFSGNNGTIFDKVTVPTNSKQPHLYITMMLSMSFFWKDERMLSSLARTISGVANNHNGQVFFLFYTIEAYETLKFFEKYGSDKVNVGPIKLHLVKDSNMLKLDYPKSIVKKQTEYLVYLEDLSNLLGTEFKYVDTSPTLSKGEFILSPDEINFSSMFIGGFAKLK